MSLSKQLSVHVGRHAPSKSRPDHQLHSRRCSRRCSPPLVVVSLSDAGLRSWVNSWVVHADQAHRSPARSHEPDLFPTVTSRPTSSKDRRPVSADALSVHGPVLKQCRRSLVLEQSEAYRDPWEDLVRKRRLDPLTRRNGKR